mmetsp:Transcript_94444/g.262294  ORF Transcript_94444/g.262294 Transcript_94444/m.262294 type:complete len:270 (+) Transcript_94444:235-1044(+)
MTRPTTSPGAMPGGQGPGGQSESHSAGEAPALGARSNAERSSTSRPSSSRLSSPRLSSSPRSPPTRSSTGRSGRAPGSSPLPPKQRARRPCRRSSGTRSWVQTANAPTAPTSAERAQAVARRSCRAESQMTAMSNGRLVPLCSPSAIKHGWASRQSVTSTKGGRTSLSTQAATKRAFRKQTTSPPVSFTATCNALNCSALSALKHRSQHQSRTQGSGPWPPSQGGSLDEASLDEADASIDSIYKECRSQPETGGVTMASGRNQLGVGSV